MDPDTTTTEEPSASADVTDSGGSGEDGGATSDGAGATAPAPPADGGLGARLRSLRVTPGGVGDALAVAVLVATLWWFESHDGGLELPTLRWAALLALVALPVAAGELARLPRWVAWLVAAWGVGIVASVAFATVRSGFVRPAMTYALVAVVFLLARRLWRRPWGPTALAALLMVSLGLYWHRSFLQWWGQTMLEQQPRWMALSWHNQSGILMGAFGLLFLGVAVETDRVWRWAAALLGAAGLTGAWLSSSRGAVLATAGVAAGMAVTALWRGRDTWAPRLVTLVAVAALTLGITTTLLAMDQREAATTPLESRAGEQSTERNTRARLYHAGAALGMFADRPITGQGLGSYRDRARPFTDHRANLTSSAHNEYVETLGEGGIVLGGAFLVANLAALVAAGAVPLRRRVTHGLDHDAAGPTAAASPPSAHDAHATEHASIDAGDRDTTTPAHHAAPPPGIPRRALVVGAAGAIGAIGVHTAIDFDWGYPVIPVLWAIGAAVLLPLATRGRTSRVATAVGAVALAVALAGSALAASVQIAAPRSGTDLTPEQYAAAPLGWDLETLVPVGYTLWRDGHHDLAADVAERGLGWHPASTRLATLRALVAFEQGELTAAELAEVPDPDASRFDEYRVIAERLIDAGELELAGRLLDEQRALLEHHRAWGVTEEVVTTWPVRVRLAHVVGGCDAARDTARTALDDDLADLDDDVTLDDVLGAAEVDC